MKTAKPLYSLLRFLFGGKAASISVATQVHFETAPETAWDRIQFYEEAHGIPPLLLRMLIPQPLRTEGDKTAVGSRVVCAYEGGNLIKVITALEAPHLIQFEILEQHLGIESCVAAQSGSYRICPSGTGANVLLTTNYQAYLRPRWLWNQLEKLAVHQIHSHILNGMRNLNAPSTTEPAAILAKPRTSKSIPRGEMACTASHSRSRH